MEYDKFIAQVNQHDGDFANGADSMFERFQKLTSSVKSASDDINKYKRGKDAVARLKSLYRELGGRPVDWDDLPQETRRGADTKEKTKIITTKPSDRILKEISQNVGVPDNPKAIVKIERLTLCQEPPDKKVIVKQEKIDAAIAIKKEMLPPKETAAKKGAVPKRKQPVRTKNRATTRNQDDIVLREPEETDTKRSTRTKTKKLLKVQTPKRIRSPSNDSLQKPQAKRIKNSSKVTASSSESEAYHTPKSDFESNNSPEHNPKMHQNKATPVVKLIRLRKSLFDKHMVKMIQKEMEEVAPTNAADIMTDDESVEGIPVETRDEGKENPEEDQISPVKKYVAAFEKLASKVITDTPVQRVTRTKTRNLAKTNLEETQTPVKTTQIKETYTPMSDRFMPTCISTAKTNRKMPAVPIPAKTLSAIKESQKEFRDLEERRRKREADMAKKREAIVQAAMDEENRRQLEKERMLRLKQREDAEKRKLLAKERSEERRREEEARRAEEERLKRLQEENERSELQKKKLAAVKKTPKRAAAVKNTAIYMVEKAPLLPSYDCYDSDDPDAKTSNGELQRPDWTRSVSMHISLKTILNIDDKLKNTMFCPTPQTPDLEEIFENIDPQKLRRNSSAIWNYRPRFTLMPLVNEDF